MIKNPILPGFNPDPSICRVGEDYYIATSTFEWYPGVQIHHSRDLVNWTLIRRPLERKAQLDMRGNPDSCGIWAPCLSYADGKFWLVYTDVKRLDGNFKDAHNYIVTAERIEDDWSTRSTSIPLVSTPRCSMMMTAASGSSTCSGTIVRKAMADRRNIPPLTESCARNGIRWRRNWSGPSRTSLPVARSVSSRDPICSSATLVLSDDGRGREPATVTR